jgi:zinc/manganese transport system substrate-binding protein
VWGDVVRAVGGDAVTVTALIHRTDQDPHDYEATVRDQLAVRRARLVVENGGGYDDFLRRLAAAAPDVPVLNVAALSGRPLHPAHGDFNEHLWYDLPTAKRVAAAVAARLTAIAPDHRADFERGLKRFDAAVSGLERREAAIRRTAGGAGVAITEPVPLYLTSACGLVNRTEEAFSSAVEEGADVAPAVLERQLRLLTRHEVALLVVNGQTVSPTTDRVVATARAARVPVVVARETLPPGKSYLAWMRSDLDAVAAALR